MSTRPKMTENYLVKLLFGLILTRFVDVRLTSGTVGKCQTVTPQIIEVGQQATVEFKRIENGPDDRETGVVAEILQQEETTYFDRLFALYDAGINPTNIIAVCLDKIGVTTEKLNKVQGTPESYWLHYSDSTRWGRGVVLTEDQLKQIWEMISYFPPPPAMFDSY